ncbi:AHH domain-containing protein [Falcatimonas sp. MSJ-15]|nr:AHH domain-containing protein [Falcatimonas sp. MSJ-15]
MLATYTYDMAGRVETISFANGLNLYAFCANNPVMYVDPSGYVWKNSNDNPLFKNNPSKSNSQTNFGAIKNNMLADMGMNRGSYSTDSHQAQHLIPQEVYNNSQFLQNIDFNLGSCEKAIFDINANNNTNSLHTLLQQNNICPDAISKYVSDNTNHSGYHKLYSDEVQKQIDGIAKEMSDKRNSLIRSGMDTMMAETMIKAKSQEKVRN